jgi:hypothetical protein
MLKALIPHTFDRLKGYYGAAVSIKLDDLQSSVRITGT